jgi:hypothetical protein
MRGQLRTSVVPTVAMPGLDSAEQSISDRTAPRATKVRIDSKTVAFGGPPKHCIEALRSSCLGQEGRIFGWM